MTANNFNYFIVLLYARSRGGKIRIPIQQIRAFVILTGFPLETMKTVIPILSSELTIISACPSNIQPNKKSHILICICMKRAQAPMEKLAAKFKCDEHGVLG